MKNLITLAFMAGLATMAACTSEDDSSGTGGAAGSASGGTGGAAGSASGGMAGMGAMGGMAGSGTGGSAGSTGDGGMDCLTCASTQCATEFGTCFANTDCKAIYDCATGVSGDAGACTTQACIDACIAANPNGKTAWDAADACLNTKCSAECQ